MFEETIAQKFEKQINNLILFFLNYMNNYCKFAFL